MPFFSLFTLLILELPLSAQPLSSQIVFSEIM
jgi:hypothetical protein